jgi:predicted nucleotidyltransferase
MLGNLLKEGYIIDFKELNKAYQKTLLWFFSYPTKEFGLNELSTVLKISKTTAKRVVMQLVEEGFLKKEVIGKVWRISCNQNHKYNFTKKVAYNLMQIFNSGLVEEIKKLIENPRAIILFGSYRKGDDDHTSDIDIAAEVLDNKDLRIMHLGVLKKFGYRKNVAVNLHIFSRKKIDLNLFSNIVNGIVLEGFLEARP